MPLSSETLALARQMDRQAAEQLLTTVYPAVWRMAHALTGSSSAGNEIVRSVFRTALRVMPTWGKGLSEENWFYHHTLQSARQFAAHPPAIGEDLLVTSAPEPGPEYLAFVSAFRKLPFQQREAFLLRRCERFTERQLGIAMDSSTTAATLHLRAAAEALAIVSGNELEALTAKLGQAYEKLSPVDRTVIPFVRGQVGRAIWRLRVRRLVRRIIALAILGALVYAGWRYRAQLMDWYHNWQNSGAAPSTQPAK